MNTNLKVAIFTALCSFGLTACGTDKEQLTSPASQENVAKNTGGTNTINPASIKQKLDPSSEKAINQELQFMNNGVEAEVVHVAPSN